MSSVALSAIHAELCRLQQEGVEHVFVDESTLSLLQPVPPQQAAPVQPAVTTGTIQELDALIDSKQPPTQKNALPASTTSRTAKPIPQQAPEFELPDGDPDTQLAWLQDRVENCPVCNEHLSEDGKVVFGSGSLDAAIFFCGEAPGTDEAIAGEPFVGKAGELLTKIIQAMGLQREQVYLANILKWRPEHDKSYGTRSPTIEEMNFCLPYLKAQIRIVQPKVIVALGNSAVTGLLGPDPGRRMGSIRGTWHQFADTPLMITFHPAYLLAAESDANPNAKKRLHWEDLLQVMEKAGIPISDRQRGFFLPRHR